MNLQKLKALLEAVGAGQQTPSQAIDALRSLPFEDLDFAKLDHHRELRAYRSEVVYGAGKTPDQLATIAEAQIANNQSLLITKTNAEAFRRIREVAANATFVESAGIIRMDRGDPPEVIGTVGVVAAGTSDLPISEEAALCASYFGMEVRRFTDVGVAGVHRLLPQIEALRQLDALIVVAGMEGALPSVVGGLVHIPIVAVPTSVGYGAHLNGFTALLGMLNSCSEGITVVNIDNGFGAAAAVHRILVRNRK